jgi:hypothetical protein
MSLTQHAFGRSTWKMRRTRLGDTFVLRESVVARNRRIILGMILAARINLATVFTQHGRP